MTSPFDDTDGANALNDNVEEEDDPNYDALNNETFGPSCLNFDNDDWEMEHEKFSRLDELSRNNNHSDSTDDFSEHGYRNNSISHDFSNFNNYNHHDESLERVTEQMVSYCLDDDIADSNLDSSSPPPVTSSFKLDSNCLKLLGPSTAYGNIKPFKMCYVQDVEREITQKAERQTPTTMLNNSRTDNIGLPANFSNLIEDFCTPVRRSDDVEREIRVSPWLTLNQNNSLAATKEITKPPASAIPTAPLSQLNMPPPPVHIGQVTSVLGAAPPGPKMPPPGLVPPGIPPPPGIAPPGAAGFVRPQPLMSVPYAGSNFVQILQPNQGALRPPPVRHHNGIPVTPQPGAGLPPSNTGAPYVGFQQTRVYYSSEHQANNQGTSSIHQMQPPQLQRRTNNYNRSNNIWRYNNQNDDSYSGLMTEQDKNWLGSIQVMQLNSNNPYSDDYYYVLYMQKHQGNCRSKMGTNSKPQHQSRDPPVTRSVYTPQQFENSLGKLQVGSVTAPRKIIDADCTDTMSDGASTASGSTSAPSFGAIGAGRPNQSSSHVKYVLLEIEELFNTLLKVDDYQNSHSGLSGEVDIHALIGSVATTFLKENKLQHICHFLKGRKLLARLYTYELSEHLNDLNKACVNMMVMLGRKDTEQLLLSILPPIRKWISSVSLAELNELISSSESQFTALLSNPFSVSILAHMIERAESLILSFERVESDEASNSEEKKPSENTEAEKKRWLEFIRNLLSAGVINGVVERPIIALDSNTLTRHLCRAGISDNEINSDSVTDFIKLFSYNDKRKH